MPVSNIATPTTTTDVPQARQGEDSADPTLTYLYGCDTGDGKKWSVYQQAPFEGFPQGRIVACCDNQYVDRKYFGLIHQDEVCKALQDEFCGDVETGSGEQTNPFYDAIKNPIIRHYVGMAVGADNGWCQAWHTATKNYNGLDYQVERMNGVLTVKISQCDWVRTNGEKAIREAGNYLTQISQEHKALLQQEPNVAKALTEAQKAVTRLDPGQVQEREGKQAVADSWEKTHAELLPRLDASAQKLAEAIRAHDEAKEFVFEEPRTIVLDLNNLPF